MKKFIISITTALVFASLMSVSTAHASVCVMTGFTAAQSTVTSGGSTSVSWTTSGCDTVSITPSANPDNRPPSGYTGTGPLTQTTTFTAVGHTDTGATSNARSVTIAVTQGNSGGNTSPQACHPTSFTAQEYTLHAGQGTVLHWDTQGCDTVSIVPADYPGDRPPYGNITTGAISHSTEYTMTAYDANGNIGGQRFLTINIVGSNSNNNNTCDITVSASPTSISRGDTSTIRWNTSGDVDYVTVSGLSGNRSGDSSISVSPYSTTTYTARVRCTNGDTQTDTVTVRVNDTQSNLAPQALTTVGIPYGTNARLNGIAIPNSTDRTTTAWFEYGIGSSFGARTTSQVVPLSTIQYPYSDVISGLVPGVTYTYRAVVQNQNGTAYGAPASFRTTTASLQVIVQPSTIVHSTVVSAQSAPSLLKLSVESNYDRMCVNGTIDYTITYQNISNQTLEKTVLQFITPQEITYLNASRGSYDVVNKTMTIDLSNVAPGEQGIITVHARINTTAISGNLTVATASVVYTNTRTRAQEDATAYSLITVSNDCPNVLGASVFGFGSFLPNTLLGWLLLILVILALIVLARHVYKRNETV